jgi:L-ascorbate metabolism protein UlaG (beta-lactamase superfamily)
MQIAIAATRVLAVLAFASLPAAAQNVKITPVGSHPGELCANDRATIFEDPTGVRLLYDVGHTVTGADDERLGTIHAVLLSHAHGDHMGDQKLKGLGAGTCANSGRIPSGPNSNTAEVAAAKNAVIAMTSDMGNFIARKVQTIAGKPVGVCRQSDGATTVPVDYPCRTNTHLGGVWTLKAPQAERGVEITIVFASHANNVSPRLLSEAHRALHAADNTGIALGPPTGYVVKFTNGLVAYLSGDTGVHSEMRSIVREYHKANLAVYNLGSSAGDAKAAAYALNELVRPASVIFSHTNEAVTEGGKLEPGSRTAGVMKLLQGPAPHLAISGRTMEFDGSGRCVAGCSAD